MNITDVMKDVAVTDYAHRHGHLLSAFERKRLTQEQFERILYNIMQQDWYRGEYKYKQHPKSGPSQEIATHNEIVKRWMDKMTAFKTEYGLEMSPFEDRWYEYLMTGELADEVSDMILP
jgi:hypothetical protein